MTNTRVLVVDDDLDIRETLVELLQAEGFEAAGAANGKDALQQLAAQSDRLPACVVLDLMMPIMDGWACAAAIRENPAFAKVRILAVSAASLGRVPPIEADRFLAKPLDVDVLITALRGYC